MQQQEQEDKGMLPKLAALLLFCWVGQVRCGSCAERDCYDIEVKDPFSLEEGCGDPFFRLTCNESGLRLPLLPVISVSSIDYEAKTIELNTTQFWKLPLPGPYPGACNAPVNFSLVNDKIKMCSPEELVLDKWRTPDGCELRMQQEADSKISGFKCYIYSKEQPAVSLPPHLPGQFISYEQISWTLTDEPSKGENGTSKGESGKTKAIAVSLGCVAGAAAFSAAVACFCCLRRRQLRLGQDSSSKARFLFSSGKKQSSYAYNKGYSFSSGESTRFTLQQLEEATNNFSEEGRLGDGGFGTVYKGRLQDGRLVAVKKLNPWNAQGKHQFDNEVTILSQVKHPYLVQLYGCCLEGRELLLVYEFVANGTLADHLHGLDTKSRSYIGPVVACFLDWESRLNIVAQTAEALAFLHTEIDPPIFHRDVKSTNILVDESWNAKVGDFGLSRLVPSLELTHVTTAPQGTPGYLDPDYHQSYQLTDKSDVYSLGVVLMEIVSAMPPVDMSRGRKEINLATLAVSRIQEGRLDSIVDKRLGEAEDEVLWGQVRRVGELGFRCLALEKDDRPTMREVAETLKQVLGEASQRSSKRKTPVAVDSPTSVQVKWPSTSTSPALSSDSIV